MKLRPDQTPPRRLPPLRYNLILDTDSYKGGHWLLYRQGTSTAYSYIESRGGRYRYVMFAGLQQLLYQKLAQPITMQDIDEANAFFNVHGIPFNRAGWLRILEVHGGYLPLLIRAVDEGTVVPVRNVLFTVENLDPELAWLTSYFETMILRDLWTCCTIATRVFFMATRINHHWKETSDNPMSPFSLLDFSSRGTMGYSHSVLTGVAHLFHFAGSDNVPGVRDVNYHYFSDMSAWSVIASEHSISCAFGQDNDDDYIDNSLARVPEGSILSLVGDTWDIFRFSRKLVERKEIIFNKRLILVDRPDSGVIGEVLPEVMTILADGFGTQRNSKGFDVINLNVKTLQGDGMNEHTHMEPWLIAKGLKIAPDSVMTAAGAGIATADLDRDTNKWAMKASEMVIDGQRVDIFKDPITDPGKKSKRGRFALIRDGEGFDGLVTAPRVDDAEVEGDLLLPRFYFGEVVNSHVLDDIRARVAAQL